MTTSFPPNVSRVWVCGRFIDLTGAPLSGIVLFTPTASVMLNSGSRQIIAGRPFSAALDPSGYFQVLLPATTDPDMTPTGWVYAVSEPTGRKYNIAVPFNQPAEDDPAHPLYGEPTIDLVSVVPAPTPSTGTVQLMRGRGIIEVSRSGPDLVFAYDDGGADSVIMPSASPTLPLNFTDWTLRSNGALVDQESRSDDGQPIKVTVAELEWRAYVQDGSLRASYNNKTTQRTVYVQSPIWKPIKRIGVSFGFGPGTNGALCLGTWTTPEMQSTTQAQCVLTVTPTGWTYDVLEQPGPVARRVTGGAGTYSAPLAQDYRWHTIDITISGTTATIRHPDGTATSISDAKIGSVGGTQASWQFNANAGAGEMPISLYETWADDRPRRLGR